MVRLDSRKGILSKRHAGADAGRHGIELHREGFALGVEVDAIGIDERQGVASPFAERGVGRTPGDGGGFDECLAHERGVVRELPRGKDRAYAGDAVLLISSADNAGRLAEFLSE